jgi:hypothetical protein
MRGHAGFWDIDERYVRLSEVGDPLEKLDAVVPWEVFRKPLAEALKRSDGAKGGRPPYDAVLMFKIMVLQAHEELGRNSPSRRCTCAPFFRRNTVAPCLGRPGTCRPIR